jgi:hypothetical protein
MKKLAVLIVAFAVSATAAATAQDLAPAVKRKPAVPAAAPAAPRQAVPAPVAPIAVQPAAAASPAPAAPAPKASVAPQQAVRTASERDSLAALTAAAAQGGGDPALDSSLIRVMSRLVAAGRCGDAAGLAARDGRKELAARAQQLCK